MTDPIADLLTRIRNAQRAGHGVVCFPFSRLKLEVVKILAREGYLQGISREKDSIEVGLRYGGRREPVLTNLRRISRPGRRIYKGCEDMKPVRNGLGVALISTSQGIMTDSEARAKKVGGEVLCEVW